MIHLSLSSTLQLPDFKQTRFPLLSSSDSIYFSVWAAHIKPCMDSVSSAFCQSQKQKCRYKRNTHTAGVNANSLTLTYTITTHSALADMWSLVGIWAMVMFGIFIWMSNGKFDPQWEGLWKCVCILCPQWRSPVPSCLAWASAAHKHPGASSAPGYVNVKGGRQEPWFQSPWKRQRRPVHRQRMALCRDVP